MVYYIHIRNAILSLLGPQIDFNRAKSIWDIKIDKMCNIPITSVIQMSFMLHQGKNSVRFIYCLLRVGFLLIQSLSSKTMVFIDPDFFLNHSTNHEREITPIKDRLNIFMCSLIKVIFLELYGPN